MTPSSLLPPFREQKEGVSVVPILSRRVTDIPRTRPPPQIVSRPFAGRLGGNHEFTLSPDDPHYETTLEKTPDALPIFLWSDSFELRSFRDKELWKQALIEGWG
jgi:hypothetical protein